MAEKLILTDVTVVGLYASSTHSRLHIKPSVTTVVRCLPRQGEQQARAGKAAGKSGQSSRQEKMCEYMCALKVCPPNNPSLKKTFYFDFFFENLSNEKMKKYRL